ncbi:MAG: ATP-dependent DNA helicase UvrD2 [Acidimicrobiales bacterium]|nr:ATP-dependent DNA helicase UvrD2 [Acidimicrobiales bacterium]
MSPSSPSDPLLEGLTDEQRDAVTTAANPLCIIAGAGSGKTRVLTRRIAWQSSEGTHDPRRVLALTFTRRAAAELRARTRRLGLREDVAAGTFHAAALATLRRFWDHTGRTHPTLLDRRMAYLARAHPRLDRAVVADLDAEIGWARARLITPEGYGEAAEAARRRPPRSAAFVAKAYAGYQESKRERRLIDFDDVLALCHATMQRETAFADAQRWRHRHLFVDEFQDVNPLQFAVLESLRGPESTLVVVGDPDQAIYGWNGADPRFINDIDEHLPGVAVVHLRTNFRSTPEVLAAAGRVLDKEPQPAHRMSGDAPTVTGAPLDQEGLLLARAVRARRKPGAPWRHQAVLARTNAQLPALRSALEATGIPTRSRGEGALLRRPEIIDVLERWPAKGSLSAALADERTAGHEPLDAERQAMVDAFLDLARDHLVLEPDASVDEFVTALRHDDRVGAAGDAVELATFHSAKGLEWPIVHLVGLEDGLVPITFARTKAARAEEQRLLYVATTRAERELHVTWATERTVGDTVHRRAPSPWLDAFATTDDLAPIHPDVGELRERIGHDTPDIDLTDLVTPVVESLTAWREHAALQAKIAPGAVLSDAALRGIAEARPSTIDELAAVPGVGSGKARRFGPRLLEISSPIG